MSVQGRKIQGKSSKKQDLEETTNKLRAIKERQGQWMREREEAKAVYSSKSVESLGSRGKSTSTRSSSISELSSNTEYRGSSSRDPYANPRRKPLYTPPKRDQSNIITWSGKGDSAGRLGRPPSAQRKKPSSAKVSNMDSARGSSYTRSQSLKEKTYEPSNYGSSKYTTEPTASVLNSKIKPLSGFQADSERLNLNDDRNDDTYGKFDDERFDYEERRMNERLVHSDEKHIRDLDLPDKINPDIINALAETVAKKLSTKMNTGSNAKNIPGTVNGQGDDQEMSTHMCLLCHTLMSGIRHTPMALIPCGHTLCKDCTKDCNKCPSCQSRVTSSAVNTVLQQIITDFMSQKERKRLEKLELETRKYVDEYQSLSVRSNALAEEADIILNGMEDLTEKLFQEKKDFKRLEVDNEELIKKVFELQNQLDKNTVKMRESREKCDNLELKYEDEKQRLSLVEDTIKTITQSKDRVKMMVHNFAPSFNLDQFD